MHASMEISIFWLRRLVAGIKRTHLGRYRKSKMKKDRTNIMNWLSFVILRQEKSTEVLCCWETSPTFYRTITNEWFNKTSGPTVNYDNAAQQAIGVDLDNNNLSGRLPPDLGLLSNLQIFKLSKNDLTGTIPTSFWKLTQLKELHKGRYWPWDPLPFRRPRAEVATAGCGSGVWRSFIYNP